jgi:hypothetical protein
MAVAALSLVAFTANAGTVSIEWAGTGGSNSISVSPGATVVATIFLDATAEGGTNSYGISVDFDTELGNVLALQSATEFLPAGMQLNFTPGITNVVDSGAGTSGVVGSIEAGALFGSPVTATKFAIGTIAFLANSVGTTVLNSGFFNPGVDGYNDINGTPAAITSFGTASITVVPEPGTAALVGLGMLGLAIAGRKRS